MGHELARGGGHGPKSPQTDEEWAEYGIGDADEFGIFPDYRTPPGLIHPKAATGRAYWWADVVGHWDLVIADLAERFGIDLYDPAVLARPWPGVRTLILGLLRVDSRLANALRG
ncbi:MAG: hypothetical protein ACOH10_11385 [Rhodoglobus sp.]